MTIRFSTTARNAGLDAKLGLINAGAAAGKIRVYTASQPANADTAISSQTLLVEFTCADPAFAAAASGVAAIDADPDLSATAAATGTAAWARVLDSDNNVVFDGSVGTSGTDFIINTTSITSGQTVTLTTGTLTDPA